MMIIDKSVDIVNTLTGISKPGSLSFRKPVVAVNRWMHPTEWTLECRTEPKTSSSYYVGRLIPR